MERKNANPPKHIASPEKHGGGGVMAWACMAACLGQARSTLLMVTGE